MRDDADFARGELRVGFDAIDERGAACSRGECPFERDHIRPLARDYLEGAKRFLGGEALRAAEIVASHERLQMLRWRDQYGGHRKISVNQN